MGHVTLVEAPALPAALTDWLHKGKALLSQRTEVEWALADWMAEGREQFGDQVPFDFLAEELGIAPKALKGSAKVAAIFPPHLRDTSLTFHHYEAVAGLPQPDALSVLRDAKVNRWDDRQTRVVAVQRKAEQTPIFSDDDWEHHELMAIARAWNRARPSVRQDFIDLAAESHLGVIDA